eukprot:GHRR01000686.1.p1 GENE.GHRR01000686.1~~GHRR01000686.1.p1  ORF type:complete len:446 (+),score=129.49 GHRR01000686.1:589-1926(+)
MTGKMVEALDSLMHKMGKDPEGQQQNEFAPTVAAKTHPDLKMKAVQWMSKKNMKVHHVPKPMVTDPTDVLLRVTNTAICGSDLHLYLHSMPSMKSGDILGHEFMGIVEEVGDQVQKFKRGDRVLVAFDIACGACYFCNAGYHSSCDTTNPSKVQELMYGQATSGIYGYAHLTGGYQGGQAEYVRVPLADSNCLKVPEGLDDLDVLFLTDILPTAWHATEMGEVGPGDVVAIWGAGPVGILTAHCAQHRGAKRVILIDEVPYRLEHAQKKLPGVEVINFKEKDTFKAVQELCANEPGRAPDVVIEAAGFHYTKSILHTVEQTLQLENDSADILNEMITSVRKGGRISIVGVYAGYVNHLNIGAFMEKQLTMRGGQTPVQRYWPHLLPKVQSGELKPSLVITHVLPLEDAPKGYELFNDKKDGCIKVVLQPGATQPMYRPPAGAAQL